MRRVRNRVAEALERRQWPRDAAELYLLAGCLSALMAAAATNLDSITRHELGMMAKISSNEMAAKYSQQMGLRQIQAVLNKHGNIAELVTGETPKKERRRIIEQAWGSEFPVLLVARVGEEGLDAPESAVGVILAGAKTSRQTVQRLGRLLRPFPGKKARLFAIFAERTTDEKIIPLLDLVTE